MRLLPPAPLQHSRAGQGVLSLGNPATTHAGDAQGRVAEGVIRLEFADASGVTDGVVVPLEPGAPGRKRRMGEGKIGSIGHQGLQGRDGSGEIASVLQPLRGRIAILPARCLCHRRSVS